VISGGWDQAPEPYRKLGGEPLMACGRATAARLGAELLVVPGAAHEPHWEQAEVVNATLLRLWG
jgi:pimeloyl-ACP methyl ester carboxylesterase